MGMLDEYVRQMAQRSGQSALAEARRPLGALSAAPPAAPAPGGGAPDAYDFTAQPAFLSAPRPPLAQPAPQPATLATMGRTFDTGMSTLSGEPSPLRPSGARLVTLDRAALPASVRPAMIRAEQASIEAVNRNSTPKDNLGSMMGEAFRRSKHQSIFGEAKGQLSALPAGPDKDAAFEQLDAVQRQWGGAAAKNPLDAHNTFEKLMLGAAQTASPQVTMLVRQVLADAALTGLSALATVGLTALTKSPSTAVAVGGITLAKGAQTVSRASRLAKVIRNIANGYKATSVLPMARRAAVAATATAGAKRFAHISKLAYALSPMYKTEQGEAYDTMRREGLDDAVSIPASHVSATLVSAIEAYLSPLELLTSAPGLTPLVQTALRKRVQAGVRAGVVRAVTKYGVDFLKEWSEEFAQGVSTTGVRGIAQRADRARNAQAVDAEIVQAVDEAIHEPKAQLLTGWDALRDGWDQMKAAFYGVAGLTMVGLPGSVVSQVRQQRAIRGAEATAVAADPEQVAALQNRVMTDTDYLAALNSITPPPTPPPAGTVPAPGAPDPVAEAEQRRAAQASATAKVAAKVVADDQAALTAALKGVPAAASAYANDLAGKRYDARLVPLIAQRLKDDPSTQGMTPEQITALAQAGMDGARKAWAGGAEVKPTKGNASTLFDRAEAMRAKQRVADEKKAARETRKNAKRFGVSEQQRTKAVNEWALNEQRAQEQARESEWERNRAAELAALKSGAAPTATTAPAETPATAPIGWDTTGNLAAQRAVEERIAARRAKEAEAKQRDEAAKAAARGDWNTVERQVAEAKAREAVARAEASRAVPVSAPPASPAPVPAKPAPYPMRREVTASRFKTELGSEYEIDTNGNTIRTKKSPGKGQGEKHEASPVVFVGPSAMDAISRDDVRVVLVNAEGKQIKPRKGEYIPSGQIGVVVYEKATGKIVGTPHLTESAPRVGLYPFEIRYDGEKKTTHIGNRIVEVQSSIPAPVQPVTETPPAAPVAPQATKENVNATEAGIQPGDRQPERPRDAEGGIPPQAGGGGGAGAAAQVAARGAGGTVARAEAQREGGTRGAVAKPPELMTPDEMALEGLRIEPKAQEAFTARYESDGRTKAEIQHRELIKRAANAKYPVSAASVDTYGIKLPTGYVREGDRYVFKGEPASPAPPPVPVPAPAAPVFRDRAFPGGTARLLSEPGAPAMVSVAFDAKPTREQLVILRAHRAKRVTGGRWAVPYQGAATDAMVTGLGAQGTEAKTAPTVKKSKTAGKKSTVQTEDEYVAERLDGAYQVEQRRAASILATPRSKADIENTMRQAYRSVMGTTKPKEPVPPAPPAPAPREKAAELTPQRFVSDALKQRTKDVAMYRKRAQQERDAGREEMAQRYEGMADDYMSVPEAEFRRDVIDNPTYYLESNIDPFLRFKNREVNRARPPSPQYRAAPGAGDADARHAALEARAKAGDQAARDEAQRMVDEAAKNAGYTTPRLFRGSVEDDGVELPTSFEAGGGIFLTDNADVATIFTYPREYGEVVTSQYDEETGDDVDVEPGPVIEAYAKLNNPLVLTRETDVDSKDFVMDTGVQSSTIKQAQRDGYDGIIVKDTKEGVGDWMEEGTTYVVFKPSQVKLSAPFTHDAKGKLIPLSERFNPASPDIRYRAQSAPAPAPVLSALARSAGRAAEAEALRIIRRVAGPGVAADARFADAILREDGRAALGKTEGSLVTIARGEDMPRTAWHEAYHVAENALFTPGERARAAAMQPDAEARADAFMAYANARGTGWTGALRGLFDRLMYRVRALFGQAREIDALRALHGRLLAGHYAKRGAGTGAVAGAAGMVAQPQYMKSEMIPKAADVFTIEESGGKWFINPRALSQDKRNRGRPFNTREEAVAASRNISSKSIGEWRDELLRSRGELKEPEIVRDSNVDEIADLNFAHERDPVEGGDAKTSAGDVESRVVWGVKRGQDIVPNALGQIGVEGKNPNVRGLHVGDPDYWRKRLNKDYDRSGGRTINIRIAEGDRLVTDRQYVTDPDTGEKADSAVLLTARKTLKYGADWVFDGEDFANTASPQYRTPSAPPAPYRAPAALPGTASEDEVAAVRDAASAEDTAFKNEAIRAIHARAARLTPVVETDQPAANFAQRVRNRVNAAVVRPMKNWFVQGMTFSDMARVVSPEFGDMADATATEASQRYANVRTDFLNRFQAGAEARKGWDRKVASIWRPDEAALNMPYTEALNAVIQVKAAYDPRVNEDSEDVQLIRKMLAEDGLNVQSSYGSGDIFIKDASQAQLFLAKLPQPLREEADRLDPILSDLGQLINHERVARGMESDDGRRFYAPIEHVNPPTRARERGALSELPAMDVMTMFSTGREGWQNALRGTGKSSNPIKVVNAYDALNDHIENAALFIGYSPWQRKMDAILKVGKPVEDTIRTMFGRENGNTLIGAMNDNVKSIGGISEHGKWRTAKMMLSRLTRSRLMNPWTYLSQSSSLWSLMSYYGFDRFAAHAIRPVDGDALRRVLATPEAAALNIRGMQTTYHIATGERSRGSGARAYAAGGIETMLENFHDWLMRKSDFFVVNRAVMMALGKGREMGLSGPALDAFAATDATRAVAATQAAVESINRSVFARDTTFLGRPLHYMRSDRNAALSRLVSSYMLFRSEKDRGGDQWNQYHKQFATDFLAFGILNNIHYALIRNSGRALTAAAVVALGGKGGAAAAARERDRKRREENANKAAEVAQRAALGLLRNIIEIAPGGELVAGAGAEIGRALTAKSPNRYDAMTAMGINPLARQTAQLVDGMRQVGKFIKYQEGIRGGRDREGNLISRRVLRQYEHNADVAMARLVQNAGNIAGSLTGTPIWFAADPLSGVMVRRIGDGR